VEDDADAFAAGVVALLRDDAAWARRCCEQVDYARDRFSRAALTDSLLGAMAIAPAVRA
jgi:hypothetical protein